MKKLLWYSLGTRKNYGFEFLMQVIADDPEGSVINSFINMEGSKPKYCDALLKQLLQLKFFRKTKKEKYMYLILLWCSSKEDSLKDLQGLAGQLFSKTN